MCMIKMNVICGVFFPYLKLFKQTGIDASFMFHLNSSCAMFELWIGLLGKLHWSSAFK